MSADATTAYGLSPQLVIHDELGLVRGPRSPLFEALETATGAQENPLSIIISTQAATDADLLSVLIDDALAGNDPHTVVKLYTAPKELDPFDEATIRLANPAFGTFLNAKEVLAMANDAKRMPARQAEYANLILNQRTEASSPFVTPALWQACSGAPLDLTGRDVVGWSRPVGDARSDRTGADLQLISATRHGMYSQRSGCQAKGCTTRRAWIAFPTTSGVIKATCRRRRARR